VHYSDRDDWIDWLLSHWEIETVCNKCLERLVALTCASNQIEASVRANHLNVFIYTKVLAVTAADIRYDRTDLEAIQKLCYPRPRLIACVAEMRSNFFVNIIDVLLLHVSSDFGIQIWLQNFSFFTFSRKLVFLYCHWLILTVTKERVFALARISFYFPESKTHTSMPEFQ
jgi:hypothetical protein